MAVPLVVAAGMVCHPGGHRAIGQASPQACPGTGGLTRRLRGPSDHGFLIPRGGVPEEKGFQIERPRWTWHSHRPETLRSGFFVLAFGNTGKAHLASSFCIALNFHRFDKTFCQVSTK